MIPLVKWAGGKRRLAPQISDYLATGFKRYFEPFVGGAGLLLYLQPKDAICFDVNEELINFYNIVKKSPEKLIGLLEQEFIPYHSKDFYYEIRNIDRNKVEYDKKPKVWKAARFLYLNKTCFNGLWRVNASGEFNVPFGRYAKPSFTPSDLIIKVSNYFNESNITFRKLDYTRVVDYAKEGDLVYFDPPYDLEEGQNGFISYTKSGFNRDDQYILRRLCDKLVSKGVTVAVSNSNTEYIREIYKEAPIKYEFHDDLYVQRSVGGTKQSRIPLNELLIIGRP